MYQIDKKLLEVDLDRVRGDLYGEYVDEDGGESPYVSELCDEVPDLPVGPLYMAERNVGLELDNMRVRCETLSKQNQVLAQDMKALREALDRVWERVVGNTGNRGRF
jgi:hypothetical protein